jgi:hypothetical protein
MTQLVAITVGTPVFATIATAGSSGAARDVRSAGATLDGLRLALAVDGIATLVITFIIALALLPRAPRAAAGNRSAADNPSAAGSRAAS